MPDSVSAMDKASYRLVLYGYSRFCVGMTENWSYIRVCADELGELNGSPESLVSKVLNWFVSGFLAQSRDTFGITAMELSGSWVCQRIYKKLIRFARHYGRSVSASMLLTQLSRAMADEYMVIRKAIKQELDRHSGDD